MFLIAIIHLGGTKSAFVLISRIEEDQSTLLSSCKGDINRVLFSEQALLGYRNSCFSRLST